MSKSTLHTAKSSLAYAKLAATPTETAWSQVYNAGNLFACLSLTAVNNEEGLHKLQSLGKDFFSNLEAEFFTLEDKSIAAISDAIHKSAKHIPQEIKINVCLAYFKDTALYLFLLGEGRVVMKREEKLGLLLTNKDQTKQLHTASGFLQNGDTLVLETHQFAKNISDKELTSALQLNLPNDIAETLSLQMHEHADGDQAAIIIAYHGVMQIPTEEERAEEDLNEAIQEQRHVLSEPTTEKKQTHRPALPSLGAFFSKFHLPSLPRRKIFFGLSHTKKLFLSVTVIILVLLVVSIFLTKQKQQNSETAKVFISIYNEASQSYDEGKSLANLNKALSREDLLKAETLLKDGLTKFPKGSKEFQQMNELLAKVETELGPVEATKTTAVKEVKVDDFDVLAIEKANADATGFSQDSTTIYFATAKAVFSVDKKTGKKTELIKNDDDWNNAKAIVPYQANIYLLDQKEGVLKYVASNDGFSKNTYFKTSVDLTKAVSMAIDSSIWILFSDETIKKYTKGEADSFSIKGLTTPFKNPAKIYTDKDITNLYILDTGNSRIVKLANDGSFQTEYNADILQKAKDFEVLEKEKKILILSGDKFYQIDL